HHVHDLRHVVADGRGDGLRLRPAPDGQHRRHGQDEGPDGQVAPAIRSAGTAARPRSRRGSHAKGIRMNKGASVALVVLVLLLAGGGIVLWQRYRNLESDYASVRSSQDATQLRYGDALSAIAEIQDSLSTLGVSEATRPLLPGSPAAERGLSVLRG